MFINQITKWLMSTNVYIMDTCINPLSINNLSNSNVTIHIATWFESYMASTEY